MKHTTWSAAIAAAMLTAACGGGGSGGTGASTGTLSVSLTDNPCDYRAVFVTVDRLRVHASGDAAESDAGWRDVPLALSPAQRRVNLLELQNGVSLKLGDLDLAAGRYTQLRLVLADNGAGTPANEVVFVDGSRAPLTTPSAQRSGVKLIRPFDVAPGQIVELMLDFDACRSVVRAGNSGNWLLKPTVAVIPLLDVGRIAGVATAGALVSAQATAPGQAPVVVKSTQVAVDGSFALSPLPATAAGTTYTVVVGAPNAATAVVRSVPVVRQQTTVLSTSAAPIPATASPASALTGLALPAGLDGTSVRALQTVDGVEVEVAGTVPDALTGGYLLRVPRAAARVATFPATPSTPLSFAPAAGAPATYVVEASATGRGAVRSAPVDAAADRIVPDLTIAP